jgi:hypothetical protein
MLAKFVKCSHAVRVIFFANALLFTGYAKAQEQLTAAELKKLSVEELMNVRVTLVSRTPSH